MELLAAACLGLGLSAAGGLRIFLPLLVVGLGERLGMVELGSSLAWTGGTPALAKTPKRSAEAFSASLSNCRQVI